MFVGCLAQVLRGQVDVDLGAGDLLVTQKIAQRDQAHSFLHQVRGEGVPKLVR